MPKSPWKPTLAPLNAIAFALFRRAGVPAPRTAYAQFTFNVPGLYQDAPGGYVYTLIENVGGRFLKNALPPGNAEAQTKGIVAFRMPLARVETKLKLSQNRDLEDRHRVIARLEDGGDDAKATAAWMKRVLP